MLNDIIAELEELNRQKKSLLKQRAGLFKKHKSLSERIRLEVSLIADNKELIRSLKNKFFELKGRRNILSKEIAELINDIKIVYQKLRNFPISSSSDEIKGKIENLEWKLQTEVVSLSREDKIMDTLKKLKYKLTQCFERDKLSSTVKALDSKIVLLKYERSSINNSISNILNELDEFREKVRLSSTLIKTLREQRKGLDVQISGVLKELNDIKLKVDNMVSLKNSILKEFEDSRRKRELELLNKKAEILESNIKNRKLTTDDFIVAGKLFKEE